MARGLAERIWALYRDGFRNMTVGRSLWALIIVKLVLFLVVLKLFFFPDILEREYDNDADRAAAVRVSLSDVSGISTDTNQ
ncbi:MAG: DUF4492 domain-containing protein [Muribaculaceae bacterium]|nr:DUF4492 domain-containing protein [Muribaculaceae bacterium]